MKSKTEAVDVFVFTALLEDTLVVQECSGQEGMSPEGELEMFPALTFYFICFISSYFFLLLETKSLNYSS